MDPRHPRLPPSNHIQNIPSSQSRWRSTQDRHAGPSPMTMQIPGRRVHDVPPPLPPPKYVSEDYPEDDGDHPWGHGPGARRFEHRGPAGGGCFPKSWGHRMDERKSSDRPRSSRLESATAPSSLTKSPTDSERRYEAMRIHDEGYYSLSASNPAAQHLPGEKQLHHRDQEKSSQAYDKGMLSKIGKPTGSPSRTLTFGSVGSVESSPTSVLSFSQRHPSQFRSLSFPNSASSSLSDPIVKQEPSGRFADSPRSRPISPRSHSITAYTEFRSPTFDRNSRSSTIDSDNFPQPSQRFPTSINISRQQKSRRSGSSGSLLSKVDESAVGFVTSNPVKRENYEPPIFSEQDSTCRMAEDVRHLHLEDSAPSSSHPDSAPFRFPENFSLHRASMSRASGTKRKLSHENQHSDMPSAAALTQQAAQAQQYINAPQHLSAQNVGPYGHHQGSISSQSSGGYRHDSYASSAGPSVGDGSYTSMEQHSPGNVSPTTDAHHYIQVHSQDHQYPHMQMNSDSKSAGPYPSPQVQDSNYNPPQKPPSSSRKQSVSSGQPPYSCRCCLKKPKKFPTLEELNQHENEKQYHCMFCQNKFKNKNEAERHQNSIHRRTNSWSCAELERHDDAFFPTTSFNPTTTGGQYQTSPQATNGTSPTDLCGYCGEEFSNEPRDPEARQQHLLSVHKFGECNRAKKFYRADHFRQHLKHSHAGKNGKHTNALEQRCARDENPPLSSDNSQSSTPTQVPSAPVANMGNLRPNPQIAQQAMNQHDVNQAQMQSQTPQGNMGPPSLVTMDMSNIDPSINYMQQQQQTQGLQQLQDATGGGYEYKTGSS